MIKFALLQSSDSDPQIVKIAVIADPQVSACLKISRFCCGKV